MKAVIVYESMYGNTHHVANAIVAGLLGTAEATAVPVGKAPPELIESADLLVVGGPTHVDGMARGTTRAAAVEAADKAGSDLDLEPDAEGTGLRDWSEGIDRIDGLAAAFDTRVSPAAAVSGRASTGRRRLALARADRSGPWRLLQLLVAREPRRVPDLQRRVHPSGVAGALIRRWRAPPPVECGEARAVRPQPIVRVCRGLVLQPPTGRPRPDASLRTGFVCPEGCPASRAQIFIEGPYFIMERKMLFGIKARAEHSRPAPPDRRTGDPP